jgi:UrcA family protein
MRGSIIIAAVLSATAAAAQPPAASAPNAVTVRYSAPELNTGGGGSNLVLRIRIAGNRLCGGDDPVARTVTTIADCRRATEAHAAAELGAPLVSHALGLTTDQADIASR